MDDRQMKCAAQHFGLWACQPRWLSSAVAAYNAGSLPKVVSDDDLPLYAVSEDGIALVSVSGQITKGDSSFGGTSSIRVRRAVREAVRDSEVKGIMLAVDSPGGTVAGTQAAGDAIYEARAQKPVFAHGDDLVASAAYWMASQAERVSASQMTEVGSIGTVAMVQDTSGMAEQAGVKVHVVSTGAMKGAFAPGTEVTDEQLEWLQTRVNEFNEFFLKAVKRGRGTDRLPMGQVRQLATGEDWLAEQAREHGLIDAVGTFEEAMTALRREVRSRSNARGSQSRRTSRMTRIAELS